MSTIIMSACWPLQMPATQKAVLISLADNANDAGVCWPSIPTICERVCASRRAVIDALSWLEEAGALQRSQRAGTSTSYVVMPGNFNPDFAKKSKRTEARGQMPPSRGANAAPVQMPPSRGANAAPVQMPPSRGANAARGECGKQHEGVQMPPPNRKEPSINRKEPSIKNITPKGVDLLPGVDPQIAEDFIAMRKSMRAPITATAVAGIEREAAKAGLTIGEALAVCCERGWRGFKAEWLRPEELGRPATHHPPHAAPSKSLSAVQRLQRMKNEYLDSRGNSGRPEPTALPAIAGHAT